MAEHAIVLGASMSGLLTARVLTEHFDRVTVIDRDDLPTVPEPRKGVPQGRHTHGLLARGREVLDELFPGLTQQLADDGGVMGDMQEKVRWYNDGHLLRQRASGMLGLAVSRPLLEHRVRTRVRALPGVAFLSPADVLDLIAADGRVGGVRIRRRGGGDEPVMADLVADATGRGSHTPVWLESLGFPRPEESRIDIGLGYVTWLFPRLPGDLDGHMGAVVGATVAAPRFGVALAQELDRWIVTAGGYQGDHAPTDLAAFRAYTRSLPVPDIAELIAEREPLQAPSRYRFPSSVRRHYERLQRFPEGYLAVGDALCSFNPVYGQGMSVAALEVLELRTALADGAAGLARRFFPRVARVIDIPWDIAAGADLRLPAVPGPRPVRVRVVNSYVAKVQAAAETDPEVGRAFLRVANLLDRPESLMRPAVMTRVIRARKSSGAARPAPRPAAVPAPRRPVEDGVAPAVDAERAR